MIDFESLEDYKSGLTYYFENKTNKYFGGSVNWISLVQENEYHILPPYQPNYTEKNVFYVILGHLILKYSGKYIFKIFVDEINAAIKEVEINYKKLDLTEEEQLEILNLAKQVKERLPKLKVFTDCNALTELEKKEYLESQQK